jgi:hypothetical protein
VGSSATAARADMNAAASGGVRIVVGLDLAGEQKAMSNVRGRNFMDRV